MENKDFCPKCGYEIESGDNFCPKCGTQIIHADKNDNVNKNKSEYGAETKTKRSNKKIITCIILVFISCAIILIGLRLFIFNQSAKDSIKNEPKQTETMQAENTDTEEDTEYIFPNSNTERLTDEDVSDLTADELAFARNEIIARHGRIFTDERYKSYFENKSWYKGTVQPEEFDANYENELNDIEKANVELIKKYEGLLVEDDSANKYYASILAEYQQAAKSDFSGDGLTYPNVNKNLLNYGGSVLFYTTIDLCNDGIPELFISQLVDGDKPHYEILDIYGYENNTPQHLNIGIDLGKRPLDPDDEMGFKDHYIICENNLIKKSESEGTEQNTTTYYELQKNSITLFVKDGAIKHGDNYYRNTTGLAADPSNKKEYESILNKYKDKGDIKWKEISDFTNSDEITEESTTVQELAQTYYGNFLQYYKEQELNGFTTPDLELINPIFSNPDCFPEGYANSGTALYYTVLDLANDGVPELFISDKTEIYGAFGLLESEGQVLPLFNIYMGERTEYQLCTNNMIRVCGSGGAFSHSIEYYRVEPHSYKATLSEAICQDGENYYFATMKDGELSFQTAATKKDYKEMEIKYPINEKIEWLKLSDF